MSWLWALLLLSALLVQVLAAPTGVVRKREADPEPHLKRKFKLHGRPGWGGHHFGGGGQSEAHSYSHSFSGPFGSYSSSGSFSSAWAGHG